jgi:hypothetical protein
MDDAVREAARRMGQVRSEAKKVSSKANGALGGRPKGTVLSEETKQKIRDYWARRRAQKASENSQEIVASTP